MSDEDVIFDGEEDDGNWTQLNSSSGGYSYFSSDTASVGDSYEGVIDGLEEGEYDPQLRLKTGEEEYFVIGIYTVIESSLKRLFSDDYIEQFNEEHSPEDYTAPKDLEGDETAFSEAPLAVMDMEEIEGMAVRIVYKGEEQGGRGSYKNFDVYTKE